MDQTGSSVTPEQARKFDLALEQLIDEMLRINAEQSKLMSEAQKMANEAVKLSMEKRWYPTPTVVAFCAASAAITKLFFSGSL